MTALTVTLALMLPMAPTPTPTPHAPGPTQAHTATQLLEGAATASILIGAQLEYQLLNWEGTAALDDYLGTMAAQDQAARAAAARHAAPPAPTSGPTGACGGATNGADQFITRESGGNPAISNAGGSGAYGCYQIMPATWASSCSDLGAEVGSSVAIQAECASRLPLSAWGT